MLERPNLTGPQLRAARALLDITAGDLAEATKLGLATIRRAERGQGKTQLTVANADKIVTYLEQCGVTFASNGEGVGVFLRRSPAVEQVAATHASRRRRAPRG